MRKATFQRVKGGLLQSRMKTPVSTFTQNIIKNGGTMPCKTGKSIIFAAPQRMDGNSHGGYKTQKASR